MNSFSKIPEAALDHPKATQFGEERYYKSCEKSSKPKKAVNILRPFNNLTKRNLQKVFYRLLNSM